MEGIESFRRLYLLTIRYIILLVLSSAMLQFCKPYRIFPQTRGDSSSPESTMAQRREFAMLKSVQTSEDELSILCRERMGYRVDAI